MIVTSLGYGYVSKYLLKKIASDGVKCIGVTDNIKYIKKKNIENITILPRVMTIDAIKNTTHLVVTAPPEGNKCPILSKYEKEIKKSNIRAIVYLSSTGVYGDHNGQWVDENSSLRGTNNIINKNRIKAENSWKNFCKKNLLIINIVRLGGIYGPGRLKSDANIFKNIITKTEISAYQDLVRRVPVADNVIEYAVKVVGKTRPNSNLATDLVNEYVAWGAGPRASQNLILAAKAHAVVRGKFSPDIEDVQAVSNGVLRHRILKNYKAAAEGLSVEQIIKSLL